LAIDATLPQSEFPGAPKPTLPRSVVPDDILEKVTADFGGAMTKEWPTE